MYLHLPFIIIIATIIALPNQHRINRGVKSGALSRRTSTTHEKGMECLNKTAETESYQKQKIGLRISSFKEQVEQPRLEKVKRPWTKLSTVLVQNGLGYCHANTVGKYPGYTRHHPELPLLSRLVANSLIGHRNTPTQDESMFLWLYRCQALREPRTRCFHVNETTTCIVNMFTAEGRDLKVSPTNPPTREYGIIMSTYRKREKNAVFFGVVRKNLNAMLSSVLIFLSGVEEHFISSYMPPPHAHHSSKSTVVSNSFHKMFHSLSAQKLLPSFNIGILLALIQCLVCMYKERKREYSTGKEIAQVRRGEIIMGAVQQYVTNRIRALVNKIQRKKSMCTPAFSNERMTSTSTPHVLQNKVDHTHVYNLKKFFKSCVTGNGEGPEVAATLTPLTLQTQLTPLLMTPQTQLTPLSLTPQTQLTPRR